MRCPDCNKFVSLDVDGDPEVELEADETTGQVTGTVVITNVCQGCGTELTSTFFDVDVDFEGAAAHMAGHEEDEAHALDLPEPDVERTCRQQGKGRGTRTFYGAQASLTVRCKCGFEEVGHWEDEVQASSMDSLN